MKSLWNEKKMGEIILLVGNISAKQKLLALDLSQFQIMHFASHAKVNWDYPELTTILLTTENYTESNQLLLSEINRWKLHAELVVLSACETAAGKLVGGEGNMGLSRAFFEAGAKRVIASFWPVEDSSSAYLMEHFYRFLLLENKSPVDALQQAQQAVSKVSRWSHPYYWSGMAYFGKPEAWRE